MDGRQLLKEVCVAREAIHLLHRQHLTAADSSTDSGLHGICDHDPSKGNSACRTPAGGKGQDDAVLAFKGSKTSSNGVFVLPVTKMEEQLGQCEERLAFYLQNIQDAIQSLFQRCQHLREELVYTTNRNRHLNESGSAGQKPLSSHFGGQPCNNLNTSHAQEVEEGLVRCASSSSIPLAMAWSEVLYQAALVFSFFRLKMLPDVGHALRQLVDPPLGDTMKEMLESMFIRPEGNTERSYRDEIQKLVFAFLGLIVEPSASGALHPTQGRRSSVLRAATTASCTPNPTTQEKMVYSDSNLKNVTSSTHISDSQGDSSPSSVKRIIAISNAYVSSSKLSTETRRIADPSADVEGPPRHDVADLWEAIEGCATVFPHISVLLLRRGASCLDDEEKEILHYGPVKCHLLISPHSRRHHPGNRREDGGANSMIPSRTLEQFLHGLQARLGTKKKESGVNRHEGASLKKESSVTKPMISTHQNNNAVNAKPEREGHFRNEGYYSNDGEEGVEEDVMDLEAALQALLGSMDEPNALSPTRDEATDDSDHHRWGEDERMYRFEVKGSKRERETDGSDEYQGHQEVSSAEHRQTTSSFHSESKRRVEDSVMLVDGGRQRGQVLEGSGREGTTIKDGFHIASNNTAGERHSTQKRNAQVKCRESGSTISRSCATDDDQAVDHETAANADVDAESDEGHSWSSHLHSFSNPIEAHRRGTGSHLLEAFGEEGNNVGKAQFSEVLSSRGTPSLNPIADDSTMWAMRLLGSQVLEYHDGPRSKLLSENRLDRLHSAESEKDEVEGEAPFRVRQRNLDIFLEQIKLSYGDEHDNPMVDSSRYLFQVSISISDTSRQVVLDAIVALGSRVDTGAGFNPECTHLVVGSGHLERSEKYLCACAAGVLMVSPEFVLQSSEAGHWLCSRDGMREYDANPTRAVACGPGQLFRSWRVVLFAEEFSVAQGIRRVLMAGGCKEIVAILRGTSHAFLSANETASRVDPREAAKGEPPGPYTEFFTIVHWNEENQNSHHLNQLTTSIISAKNLMSPSPIEKQAFSGLSLLSQATHLLIESRVFSVVQRGHFSMPEWMPSFLWSQELYYSKMFSLDLLHYCLCARSVEIHGGRVFDDSGSLIPDTLPGAKCRLILPIPPTQSSSASPLSSSLFSQSSP